MVWAYQQDVPNPGQKFTLVTAAQYCNDQGICWVGQETLAEDMSMSARSVRTHLGKLEEQGLIVRRERRRRDGTRSSDLIELVGFNRKISPVEDASTGNSRQDNRKEFPGNNRVKRQGETLVTTTTRECLEILSSIAQFPRDEDTNIERLEQWQKEFPEADPVAACKDFAAYCSEKPIKAGEQPRLRLRNFFKKANAPDGKASDKRKSPSKTGGNNENDRSGRTKGYEELFGDVSAELTDEEKEKLAAIQAKTEEEYADHG
jgi:DNA-binding transcriptional ArsR family regulator